tara:strand:+ start:259 stop:576 length:318 start_codon:yes stop_codon:yes gene_type:complete
MAPPLIKLVVVEPTDPNALGWVDGLAFQQQGDPNFVVLVLPFPVAAVLLVAAALLFPLRFAVVHPQNFVIAHPTPVSVVYSLLAAALPPHWLPEEERDFSAEVEQ